MPEQMIKTVIARPVIDEPGELGFLLWARRDQPRLYAALVAKFPAVRAFEDAYQQQNDNLGFDFSSVFSSIGSAVKNTFSGITSFVKNNATSILSAGAGFAIARQQARVAEAQLAVAQAGQTPLQTGAVTQPDGAPYVIPIAPTGTNRVQSNAPAAASPVFESIPNSWLIAGGAGLLAILLLSRSR